ncbi:hypothetical protein EON77_01685 [bacterium]|nr:MAG: hypothetical protein EON77_01685 [bacterium]
MPPKSLWNTRRIALVSSATILLILAVLLAPPPPAAIVPGRYHYYVTGLSGLYTANPSDGLAGSLRLWGFRLIRYLPSLLLALTGLFGLALGFRGTRPRRR